MNMNYNYNQAPMKGIKNSNIGNYSYAHSVLQSLCCLICINNFLNYINKFIKGNNNKYQLTNALYNLIFSLIHGREGSSELILDFFKIAYNKNSGYIESSNVLNQDPFHFLYFLLLFLHNENIVPKNNNNNLQNLLNQNLQTHQNDDNIFHIFISYMNETQDSIISNIFFTIERYKHICYKCGTYYSYGVKNLIRINVDKIRSFRDEAYPQKKNTNINLDDCLLCYCGVEKRKCKFSKIHNIERHTQFVVPANVFIISLERNQHCYRGDVDFQTNLNLIDYINTKRTQGININSNYILKSVISYSNLGHYFADCFINNSWYRFINDQIFLLNGVRDVYEKEPQILIYELTNQNNSDNSSQYCNVNLNNNNNCNNFNSNNFFNNNINNDLYNNNGFNNNILKIIEDRNIFNNNNNSNKNGQIINNFYNNFNNSMNHFNNNFNNNDYLNNNNFNNNNNLNHNNFNNRNGILNHNLGNFNNNINQFNNNLDNNINGFNNNNGYNQFNNKMINDKAILENQKQNPIMFQKFLDQYSDRSEDTK